MPTAHGSSVPFLGSRAWAHGPRATARGEAPAMAHGYHVPRRWVGCCSLPAPWAPTPSYHHPPIIDKEIFALRPKGTPKCKLSYTSFSTGQNSLFLATLCLFLDLYCLYIHSRSFISLVAHGSRPAARGS